MKNVIRWGLAGALAAALALFGSAQAQSSTSSERSTGQAQPGQAQSGQMGGTAAGSQAQAGQKVDKGLQEKLEEIHAANEAEVQMAQMASDKAESPDVKQFADQLQSDHQKLGQKLTQTAQAAGIPSLEGKAYEKEHASKMKDVEKLQSKSGTDFDKAFMSRIVKDHEKSVKATEKAAKDARKANRTQLASFLENASAGMQHHLDAAKQIEKSLGKAKTPTGTGSGASQPSGSKY